VLGETVVGPARHELRPASEAASAEIENAHQIGAERLHRPGDRRSYAALA
jgi:hypothetical protein